MVSKLSKVVKTLAIVAIAVAVVVFAPQIAGMLANVALSAGLTTVTGAFALAASLTSVIVGVGLSIGLSAGLSLFQKKPALNQASLDRLNSSVNPTAPRKIVFGRTAAGNDVRFAEQYGSKKDAYVQIVAMASHRINAFLSYHVEDQLCYEGAITGSKSGGFNSFVSITEGASTNGFAVGSGGYWTSSSTFTGCAYYAVDYHLSQDVWTSPPTRTTAIVEGCPLYDPRRDSTNGGSGSCRTNNQLTWLWRDNDVEIGRNPALALLTYLIGYRINNTLVWGMGVPLARIDLANFITYANLCEAQVATLAGEHVQRYTFDGILSTGDSHETNIAALTSAMGCAKLTDVGGQYGLIGGYDDTLGPKVNFTPDDFVSGLNWKVAGSPRDTYNIVRGRFADANNLYVLSDWGEIVTDPLPDNVPRTLTLDLAGVTRAETAQRIAKQFLLREAKTPGLLAATFGPKAFLVQVGSLVTISHQEQGWNNKLFRVIDQAESHDLMFQMTLREESSEVYAWDREEKPLPATIRPPGYDPSQTITPSGLSASSDSYAGANRVNVSQVTTHWTAETSGRVAGIQIQSKLADTSSWTEQAALFDAAIGVFTFASNAPGVSIDVRARFRMTTGIYSPWATVSVDTAPVIVEPDWSNVTDDAGTRPANNATNTRDPATPFGNAGGTVGGVLTTVNDHATDIAAIQTAIQNTEQGANAATEAAASRAEQAKAASEAASAASQAARDQGVQARADALSYRDQADQIVNSANGSVAQVQQRTSTLEAQMAGTADSNLNARLHTTETTLSNGSLASASSVTSLQSQLAGATQSALKSSIDTVSQTFTTKTDALANRSSALEASASRNSLNTNPDFQSWPDGQAEATGWSTWEIATSQRWSGVNGKYAVYQAASGATQTGFAQFALRKTRGWFVIEADVRIKGSFIGAGVGFYGSNEGLNLQFHIDPDVNGIIRSTSENDFWTYRFRKLVNATVEDYGAALYAFTAYGGIGAIGSLREIVWDHVAVRAATDGEIAGRRADINANSALARISTEETVRYNETQALADRSMHLEAKFAGSEGSALKSSFDEQITVLSNNSSSLATRATTLEARTNGAGPNRILNGDFSQGLANWNNAGGLPLNTGISGWFGSYAGMGGNGPIHYFQDVYVDPGLSYSLSLEGESDTPGNCYGCIEWLYDSNTSTGQYVDYAFIKGSNYVRMGSGPSVAPAGVTLARVHIVKDTGGNYANFARVSLQYGNWTAYRNDATETQTQARLSNVETATTDGRFATATRAAALEVQSSGFEGRIHNVETATTDGRFATANRASDLEAKSGTGGNLIPNTSFKQTDGWYLYHNADSISGAINGAGDDWHPVNENALTIYQNDSNVSGAGYWFSDFIPVEVGKWYQFSAYGASHRVDVGLGLESWNAAGTSCDGGVTQPVRIYRGGGANGGRDLNNWDKLFFNFQATQPLARLQLFRWGTNPGNGDSYTWFVRPQLVQVAGSSSPLVPYQAGSNAATLGNALARISTVETATTDGRFSSASRTSTLEAQLNGASGSNLLSRIQSAEQAYTDGRFATASRASTLEAQMNGSSGSSLLSRIQSSETAYSDGRFASASSLNTLNAQVNGGGGLAATISTQGQAISTLDGYAQSRLVTTAVAGNGRAQIVLHADSNGGGGVDIVGDVAISGNLLVGGSVNTGKIADNAVTSFDQYTHGDVWGNGGDQDIFNVWASEGQYCDLSIDYNALLGYSSFGGNDPWSIRILFDGNDVSYRGAATNISEGVSAIASVARMSPNQAHNIRVIWNAPSNIKVAIGLIRILRLKR